MSHESQELNEDAAWRHAIDSISDWNELTPGEQELARLLATHAAREDVASIEDFQAYLESAQCREIAIPAILAVLFQFTTAYFDGITDESPQ